MSTSITRGQLPSDPNKNSFHGRHDSGELDVFEAARYFSAVNDHTHINRHHLQRRSLDMPAMRTNPIQIPPEYHHIMILDHHRHQSQAAAAAIENKKFKQPRSPGGRLASFLNSLFSQSHSKKKKKPKSGPAARDFVEDETPGGGGGRRKRRSSISHFLSSGEKRSPPHPYAITPTKSCKIGHQNYKITLVDERVEEKVRMRNGGNSENILMVREEDEGGESDSSSDLFDLPNHDLDFLSSGLPVYGTTHVDRIAHF